MKFKRLKLKIFISFAADYKNAQVAELVDALDSKSSSFESVGSIPTQGTSNLLISEEVFFIYLIILKYRQSN